MLRHLRSARGATRHIRNIFRPSSYWEDSRFFFSAYVRLPNRPSFPVSQQTHCRFLSTSAAPLMRATSAFTCTSPTPTSSSSLAASSSSPLPPRPPSLSILSWAVDGSGHTHHRCARRLSMSQRIPLLCETIYVAAPDVVALQDSTPELAAALTAEIQTLDVEQQRRRCSTDANEWARLKVYGAEAARELQLPYKGGDGARNEDAESTDSTSSSTATEASSVGEHESDNVSAVSPANPTQTSSDLQRASFRYRLVGKARNGRCGEVQLFVKSTSPWEAELLPGMGAGLTMELRSRPTTSSNSSEGTADTQTSTPASSSKATKEPNTSASVNTSPLHHCVLTTLDLSYRGKSLGTHLQGLLSSADVSEEGSPFTLQTQQPASGSSSQERVVGGGRAPGQLDMHRAVVFDWVHHHIQPDVLVGNLFMGARERLPNFEDAWVRAGSPSGQERTTNTCARHRVDHMTNYFYFKPSPGVAKRAAVEKMILRMEMEEGREHERHEEEKLMTSGTSAEAKGEEENTRVRDTTSIQENDTRSAKSQRAQDDGIPLSALSSSITSEMKVVVPADAAVGTPIPLDAYMDEADGAWHVRSATDAHRTEYVKINGQEIAKAASLLPSLPTSSLLSDLTTGVPEVAGRFQRCLFRGWLRRGPSSRGGHRSAHPFLQHYRRCRVVVLRPMTEVTLDAEEQAWHARYLAAQYGRAGQKVLNRSPPVINDGTSGASATGEKGNDESVEAPLRTSQVRARVRCSLSDQYPLLTLLN